jgi:hypothetical protein
MNRRKSKRERPPLQPADFRPPTLSQEKVSEICESLGISDREAREFKNYLDELVDVVLELMSQKEAANRQGDRTRISTMVKQVKDVRQQLQSLRIDGRLAVRSTAERLADIFSGDRIRYHFPNDAPSKPRLRGDRSPPRQPGTDVTYLNYQFIRRRAPETLDALLRDLESALASALTSLDSHPGARGGRKSLTCESRNLLAPNWKKACWHSPFKLCCFL